MAKSIEESVFEVDCEPLVIDCELIDAIDAPKEEPDAPNEKPDGCERLTDVDELLKIESWHPAEPQYCKAIADHYGVERRTVQKWFKRLQQLCPWLTESELRLLDDRYTPLAVELMGDCYLSSSAKKWAEGVANLYADRVEAWEMEQAAEKLSSLIPEQPPNSSTETPTGIVPVEVMGIHGLKQHQEAQNTALSLRQQATQALTNANQTRLEQLKEFFANQQNQRLIDQSQRRSLLEAEAQNEAIEEFLIKQEAKNTVLSQLEQLNSLGKLTAAPPAG